MIVTHSTSDRDACSDFNVYIWFKRIKNKNRVKVATCAQLDKLRLAHKRKEINIEYIQFENHNFSINEDSTMNEWPAGFVDQGIDLLDSIIFSEVKVVK